MVEKSNSRWKRWWWVVLVCSISVASYFQCIQEKKKVIEELSFRIEEMNREKSIARQIKEDLLLAVASQEDPAWIEMILMRDLGVVPEGWLKVHFKK